MNKNERITYVRAWSKKPVFLSYDMSLETKDEKGNTVFVDAYITIRPSGEYAHVPYIYPTRAKAREFYVLLLQDLPKKAVYKAIINEKTHKLIKLVKKNP